MTIVNGVIFGLFIINAILAGLKKNVHSCMGWTLGALLSISCS